MTAVHPVVSYVCRPGASENILQYESLTSALEYVTRHRDVIDNVWVLGGERLYAEVLSHPQCSLVYATRVYTPFEADRFFPQFEHNFELTRQVTSQPFT